MYGCGSELRLGRVSEEGASCASGTSIRCHGSHRPAEGESMPLSRRACREPGTRLAGPEHPGRARLQRVGV